MSGPTSDVETFVALKLTVDSWRWADVPVFIRAGKRLPVTAAEAVVQFHKPPRAVFGEELRTRDHVRMRLSPDVCIALGLKVKRPGDHMAGEDVELMLAEQEAFFDPAVSAAAGRRHARRQRIVRAAGHR